jgi:hypothetical protein
MNEIHILLNDEQILLQNTRTLHRTSSFQYKTYKRFIIEKKKGIADIKTE